MCSQVTQSFFCIYSGDSSVVTIQGTVANQVGEVRGGGHCMLQGMSLFSTSQVGCGPLPGTCLNPGKCTPLPRLSHPSIPPSLPPTRTPMQAQRDLLFANMTSNAAAASTLVDLFQLVSGAQPGGMGEGAAASTLVDLFQLVSGAQPGGMGRGRLA